MSYEITEHVPRRIRDRKSDASRFKTVRLTVQRNDSAWATVSVIVRDVRGGMMLDTRVYAGRIPMSPGSAESDHHSWALASALAAAFPGIMESWPAPPPTLRP